MGNVVVKVRSEIKDELKELKAAMHFKTIQELLHYLTMFAKEKNLTALATYENVMTKTETRPVILTGSSGAGKTTTMKAVLKDIVDYTVLIIDVSNEYSDVEKVGLGEFFSLKYNKNKQVRFVPNGNVEISKAEAAAIFAHLNFLKTGGELKNLVLVVEEAHRFRNDINLRSLVIEARKFIRKLVLVTTDWRDYEGIAPAFRPLFREGYAQ
jgi:replication-associated recombination protein RarA